jgi:hypothetical protein
VATPFTSPAIGNVRFNRMPTVGPSTVRDNADSLVSGLTSADVVVETCLITSNDDKPSRVERVAGWYGARLRRLDVLRVAKLTPHASKSPLHVERVAGWCGARLRRLGVLYVAKRGRRSLEWLRSTF